MNKTKKILGLRFLLLLFFCNLFLFFFGIYDASAEYTYTPMENIPMYEGVTDFPTFVLSITKFAIWTVGITALLMITIGGFMYITSAGNTSRMDAAKTVIYDSVYGLIVALASWLLLYVINPDLVKVRLSLVPLGAPSEITKGPSKASTQSPNSSGVGECVALSSGPCSVSNLQNTCFGSNAEKASKICNAESGGNPSLPSGVDKCQPNKESVSWGLFQINLTANDVGGLKCHAPSSYGAFDRTYTGSNHQCRVTDSGRYNNCVSAAKDSQKNIEVACRLSKGGNYWGLWGANRKCKL